MLIALVAVAAFLVPAAVGSFAFWYGGGGLYQAWVMSAVTVVMVMAVAAEPLCAAAGGMSAAAAAGSWWWQVGRPPWQERRREARRHDRVIRAFRREMGAGADVDLVARIWYAPRPRTPRGSTRDL